jgi:hypothetical protein
MNPETTQPDLFPQRILTTLTCEATRADAIVARVHDLGGALLSFAPKPNGLIEMHIVIEAGLVEQAMEGKP